MVRVGGHKTSKQGRRKNREGTNKQTNQPTNKHTNKQTLDNKNNKKNTDRQNTPTVSTDEHATPAESVVGAVKPKLGPDIPDRDARKRLVIRQTSQLDEKRMHPQLFPPNYELRHQHAVRRCLSQPSGPPLHRV